MAELVTQESQGLAKRPHANSYLGSSQQDLAVTPTSPPGEQAAKNGFS